MSPGAEDPRVRVAVLISGRSSNMEALIEAARDPAYPARIVLVASNHPEAAGLEKAKAAGIETVAIAHGSFKGDREGHERALDLELRRARVELVALAGYMRILSPWFVRAWKGRLVNIHPSLLPVLPGLDTHARAIAAGHERHGCTVHWVTEDLDSGPIIAQAEVPILPGDTHEALAARVLEQEHRIFPQALAEAARTLKR